MKSLQNIRGKIVDVYNNRIFSGTVHIVNSKISSIEEHAVEEEIFILPGFTDAHIHIESSMLTPVEFAKKAVVHGTVSTVSDPHEIANVCGIEGVYFMIENARNAILKINFGAPSCVPATSFETAGAELGVSDVDLLLQRPDIRYLSEMMNFPAVLNSEQLVMEKILLAHKHGKVIDGHAPGMRGKDVSVYAGAGISTDHECVRLDEALEKILNGMKIIIREGSAAKNFDALQPLIKTHPDMCMFGSDDKHPDDLMHGHINQLVKRSMLLGHDMMDILRIACINPIIHYSLDTGLLQNGQAADFIVVNNLSEFHVTKTVIDGLVAFEEGTSYIPTVKTAHLNNFSRKKIDQEELVIKADKKRIQVIDALDGQLITHGSQSETKIVDGNAISNPENDILKIVVLNRYADAKASIGFIRNFGLKKGAISSTVAHDSHNIIAVGCSDEELCNAINLVIEKKGGLCYVDSKTSYILPLPIAGLMTDQSCDETAAAYETLNALLVESGCKLKAPFMTLSFMALLVIPSLKLSDQGLFDGDKFSFTPLFID